MSPSIALPAVNFFLADVGGGLGPYLATWLAQVAKWTPAQIGYVTTVSSLAFIFLSGPAGALVDRIGKPRLFLGVGCVAIVLGTLALLWARGFFPVLAAQAVASAGGAVGEPAMVALTLGIVGKQNFPKQQGTNDAANHAGNVVAAGLVAGLSLLMGAAAAFAVLAGMGVLTLLTLFAIPGKCIDDERLRGRKRLRRGETHEDGSRDHTIWQLLRDRRLLLLVAAIGLFHLGNGAMMPLLGQKLAATGQGDPTRWMSACVIVAQLTMVPVAFVAGRLAGKRGARWLLLAACCVLPVRGAVAAFAPNVYWLVPIEVLDGLGAAMLSVAAPIAVTNLTYGGGRTQTAVGGLGTVQGIAAAVSSSFGGLMATHLGWTAAFLGLAAPPLISIGLLLRLVLDDQAGSAPAPSVMKAAASSARV